MPTQRLELPDNTGLHDELGFDESDFDQTVIGQDAHAFFQASTGIRLKSADQELSLSLSPVLIGRDASCGLQLPSRMVSRYHAAIYKAGKHHVIRDLHSTNGLTLNDVPVTRAVIRAGDTIKLGDQTLTISEGPLANDAYAPSCVVVFIDLENSTALSLQYGDCFAKDIQLEMQKLEDQILIHLGSPVKLLGDGLMCAFGLWPVDQVNYQPADQALRFARIATRHFDKLEAYPALRLRVGLHYGPVVVSERAELDLYGDTVNTASRLEDSNKYFKTQIMVSEALRKQTTLADCLREVDTIRVQGREAPIKVYSWDEAFVKNRSEDHRQAYEQALHFYRAGQFEAARDLLEASETEDPLCAPLLARLKQPGFPPAGWDGVWSLQKS